MQAYGLGKFAEKPTKLRLRISTDPISDTLKIDSHKKKRKNSRSQNFPLRNTVCVARERQPATVLTATRPRRSPPRDLL